MKDLPPINKPHPFTAPPETVDKIVALSLENPTLDCNRLGDHLKLQSISVTSPTIQDILIMHGMGSRYERLLKPEQRVLDHKIELTPQQVVQIDKANPTFKKRNVESSRLGELLS